MNQKTENPSQAILKLAVTREGVIPALSQHIRRVSACYPFASTEAFEVAHEARPVIPISRPAEYLWKLIADTKASLLVQEPVEADLQVTSRETIIFGTAPSFIRTPWPDSSEIPAPFVLSTHLIAESIDGRK